MDRERLLQRFLRYVAVDTTANEHRQGYPSSPGQLALGRLLVEELGRIGIQDVRQDEHGIVLARLPTANPQAPRIVWNAHVDTSPETTGANVRPQVIRSYVGGDIQLSGATNKTIQVADNPELSDLHGCTLITTDGTTLLGADDKAGIAIIVEAAAHLAEQGFSSNGPITLLFTCDEEIGHGADHVDVQGLDAVAAYTLDGPGADQIDVETFSADLATITVQGVNIHPSIAKDRMVNSIRAAGQFVAGLPTDRMSPESTEQREGFIHPYTMNGGVDCTIIQMLLRSFDTAELKSQANLLRQLAAKVESNVPGCQIEVSTRHQYRNMYQGLQAEPRCVSYAEAAFARLGRTSRKTSIRGGTDGSQLTAMGLPTPNLSSGQHNPHSPLEWACLDEMRNAVNMLTELARIWMAGES